MKKILLAACFVLASSQASADETTLLTGESVHGGFGGPVLKVSSLNGQTTFMTGGRGGWLINHVLFIGASGYDQTVDIKAPQRAVAHFAQEDNSITDLKLSFDYGGLFLGYINDWENLVHYSFNTLIGRGDVSYSDASWNSGHSNHFFRKDGVFVFEPGIEAEINVTKRIRVSAGASYLWVGNLNMYGLNEGGLGGLGAVFMIKYGTF